MTNLPEALPHGDIINIVDDVYYVMGSNVIIHDGIRIQSSRTMTIIRENGELTLVNSIRLNDAGLSALSKLGHIKNIIRLGAFHGRDDAFYQKEFKVPLWAFPQMDMSHGEVLDHDLSNGNVPITHAQIIELKSTKFKEALLLIEQHGGILLSCDSIKNWEEKDSFFDDATFAMMQKTGAVGKAVIDATWLKAMNPAKAELSELANRDFSILICNSHDLI